MGQNACRAARKIADRDSVCLHLILTERALLMMRRYIPRSSDEVSNSREPNLFQEMRYYYEDVTNGSSRPMSSIYGRFNRHLQRHVKR